MHISIIIPIYNEVNIIKNNIKKIELFFQKKYTYEVIIVDDGSKDGCLSFLKNIKSKNIKILSNKINYGKGYSIKRGIFEAKGDLILTMDADLSAPLTEFEKLLAKYNQTNQFVIGSRNKKNSTLNYKQSFLRFALGVIFNFLIKIILGLDYKDTQCGFKLYNAKKIKSIVKLSMVNRFCIDVEILYLAKLKSINVYEEGIEWNYNDDSTVKLLYDPINMFIDLIRIRLNKY